MKKAAFAAAIMLTLLVSAAQAAAQHLVINEIDYDQPGVDVGEFVEIYNPGSAAQNLNSIILVFVNGATGTPYQTVPLGPAGFLPAAGYLVVASESVPVAPGANVIRFASVQDNIQNGSPDGVALIDTDGATLVDALSYEGSMTSVQLPWVGQVSLVEGAALSLTVADQNSETGSLVRFPNGQDTDDASADWKFTDTITPGATNDAGVPTGVPGAIPSELCLHPNYPNPFNPRTTIVFDLAETGAIELAIYDLGGRMVRVIDSGSRSAGRYQATWDGQDNDGRAVPTGTYFCRLNTAQGSQTRKLTLAR
jgi:hypothetical protein